MVISPCKRILWHQYSSNTHKNNLDRFRWWKMLFDIMSALYFWQIGYLWNNGTVFYPRPVLAFGYCRCLCVCLSVNHQLVRAITHQPFKLESPNLDQRCERPWLRSLLFFWTIDLELQGQIELKSQIYPILSLSVRLVNTNWSQYFQIWAKNAS